MEAARLKIKTEIYIGASGRNIRRKVMEHFTCLREKNTSGNMCKAREMGMEFAGKLMEMLIMGNGKSLTKRAMDI